MSISLISNPQNLESLSQLTFQELGNGVFEKPSKLSDFLFITSGKRKIIACDNANDIRFVESVVKRKGLSIKRVSPLVNPNELNSIASWLQSKQDDVTVVCPSNVLLELIDKHPPAYIILYSPNPSEELIAYAKNNKEVKIFTLASPSELSGFITKCQSLHQTFDQINVDEHYITEAILSFIKEKLSRTKTQTPGAMSSITKTIIEDKNLSSAIIEKLLYFFLENTAGTIGESIDEELGICKASEDGDQDPRDSRQRTSRNQNNTSYSNKPSHRNEDDSEESEEDGESGPQKRRDHRDREPRNDNRNQDRRNSRDSRNGHRSRDGEDRNNYRDNKSEDDSPKVKKMRYRFYVGLGEEQELGIQSMRDLLGDVIGDECRVQRVHLRNNYSFVDMESQNLEDLLKAVSHVRYQGKLVHLDLAEEMGESIPYRGNRGGGQRGGGYNNRGGDRRGGGQNRNRNRNYSR